MGHRLTTRQRTNAFYIQSPRLQNALPGLVSENYDDRVPFVLHRHRSVSASARRLGELEAKGTPKQTHTQPPTPEQRTVGWGLRTSTAQSRDADAEEPTLIRLARLHSSGIARPLTSGCGMSQLDRRSSLAVC